MIERPWTSFPIDESFKNGIIKKLQRREPIFSFAKDPLFASLITCLGLQSEIGNPEIDRLSPALNIDLSSYKTNPWQSEIISLENKIGIRMWIKGVDEFYVDHRDFAKILHSTSINSNKKLNQIVIFPEDVALKYAESSLQLVIVRDWALSAFLAKKENQVNYFEANEYEIKNNFAYTQTQMMKEQQVAFMGTHDLVDHLLGGNGYELNKKNDLFEEAHEEYTKVFPEEYFPKNRELIVSYLIGVILDDMAQPKWYSSPSHSYLLKKSLRFLSALNYTPKDFQSLIPPQSFHSLIKSLRNKSAVTRPELDHHFNSFCSSLLE